MGRKGKVEITVGYKYYAGIHMVICEAADYISKLKIGDKNVPLRTIIGHGPDGPYSVFIDEVSENSSVYVEEPDLFGGEGGEGGVQGEFDVMFGRDGQAQNEYLRNKLGPDVPSFRGVVSLVAKQMYLSAMNPYIKPWKVKASRFPGPWEEYGVHKVGSLIGPANANPANIIYEIITENNIGPIHEGSFLNAAFKLKLEGLGMSVAWSGGSIEEFLQMILNHIGGVLYVDPVTGEFVLKLIRGDYLEFIDFMPVIDESVVKEMVSYQRTALSDTINQLTVYYTDMETGEERSVCVQNLANIAAQGKIVPDEKKYLGITDLSIATKIAMRDLVSASSTLSKLTIKVAPTVHTKSLRPGDVIVFKWQKLGIDKMVFRVGEINFGTLQDSTITIEAVEDIYALPTASYIEGQPSYWQDPVTTPQPCPQQKIFEIPYWDIVRTMSPADFDYLPKNEGVGFVGAVGTRPGTAFNYDFYTSSYSSGTYTVKDTESFCPVAFLANPVGYTDKTWQITNGVDLDLVKTGSPFYAMIEDEIITINNISTGEIEVGRGCLDTVPKPHAAGTAILFVSGWQSVDQTERVEGQTVYGKICPRTGKGVLGLSSAPTMQIKLEGRFDRPYPPANFRINEIPYPENIEIEGSFLLSWYNRNRTQQTAYILSDDDFNVTPEPGTTYTVEIRSAEDNHLVARETGITTYEKTMAPLSEDGLLYVNLWSERDGYSSWQKHEIPIEYYRAPRRVDQSGEIRTTEDGTIRITEG